MDNKEFIKKYNTIKLSPTLQSIKAYARSRKIPVLLDDSAEFLQTLVMARQPSKILEVGTAIGYSGMLMLQASLDSHLYTIEVDEASYNVAKSNFALGEYGSRVTQYLGDAKDIIANATGKYDFIFLDGPKSQYRVYLPYLIKLLSDKGVLLCDNVLFRGLVADLPDKKHSKYTIAVNLNKFLDDLNGDTRLLTTTLDIGDGMSVSVLK